ncbi:kinase-like domain-containing protein [Panaeolus papilionaceus]|nr:kinase-like domain-containing protein [Panaeolus papilionaceus]
MHQSSNIGHNGNIISKPQVSQVICFYNFQISYIQYFFQRHNQNNIPKEPITVLGIPSVSIQDNRLTVGSAQSSSTRSYTPLKVLGDGSFGTVWLCDWHGTLPPNTPLSPMQCGAGARPEWTGKRLVAVKRMKKTWEGGWDDCRKLKELESLRAIPFHPNVIPLYDFFLLPDTKELYFVFESMEGNLYHLIKTRKGRPLAGGLVSSIFRQIVLGLDHVHSHGYFHRDMKPENVLVTTTGLFDYTSVSPVAPPNAPKEKDVVAIIKLADFGLARETKSKPPYTEYVSTRWYRAPEVLLLSRDYSNPVDMWALGTIMAELVNLRPLFPGQDQVDQVARICEILGDPSDAYGVDANGSTIGGGSWKRGIDLASAVGFRFPKLEPKDFYALFEKNVPRSLIDCIRDLLRYDPNKRLTTRQCLEHPYLLETTPRNNITMPAGLHMSSSNSSIPRMSSHPNAFPHHPGHPSNYQQDPRHHPQQQWPAQHTDYPMDVVPSHEQSPHHQHHTNGQDAVMVQDPHPPTDAPQDPSSVPAHQGHKLGKLGTLSFGKKNSKWGLGGMFGGDKSNHLPPVDEISPAVVFPSSRKRTKSSSTDSRSMREPSPVRDPIIDVKKNKKEARRLHYEAEVEKRKLAQKNAREQARSVMAKRQQMQRENIGEDIEWRAPTEQHVDSLEPRAAQPSSGPVRREQGANGAMSTVHGAAAGRYAMQPDPLLSPPDRMEWRNPSVRVAKARRREFDDDHSMSSSDVHSLSRVSSISFATVDSDPGPSRIRNRPSLFGINRMHSRSSLRTSFDDFSTSARSSNSFSLEGQLAHDFRTQASVSSHISGSVSPPPLQLLSLSPTMSPSLSPSPPWLQVQHAHKEDLLSRTQSPPFLSVSPHFPSNLSNGPHSPLDLNGGHLPPLPPSSYGQPPSSYGGYPPSSGHTPKSARSTKSAINPIFKVPPLPPPPLSSVDNPIPSSNALPPFSHLEAVAGGEYPPLTPMVFSKPDD